VGDVFLFFGWFKNTQSNEETGKIEFSEKGRFNFVWKPKVNNRVSR
jgi:hypothetical protein